MIVPCPPVTPWPFSIPRAKDHFTTDSPKPAASGSGKSLRSPANAALPTGSFANTWSRYTRSTTIADCCARIVQRRSERLLRRGGLIVGEIEARRQCAYCTRLPSIFLEEPGSRDRGFVAPCPRVWQLKRASKVGQRPEQSTSVHNCGQIRSESTICDSVGTNGRPFDRYP